MYLSFPALLFSHCFSHLLVPIEGPSHAVRCVSVLTVKRKVGISQLVFVLVPLSKVLCSSLGQIFLLFLLQSLPLYCRSCTSAYSASFLAMTCINLSRSLCFFCIFFSASSCYFCRNATLFDACFSLTCMLLRS